MASSRRDRLAHSSSALEPTAPEQLGAGPSDNGRGGRSPCRLGGGVRCLERARSGSNAEQGIPSTLQNGLIT